MGNAPKKVAGVDGQDIIIEIPKRGNNICKLWNIAKLNKEGLPMLNERLQLNAGINQNRIFKVKFETWRIMVCDVDAAGFVFNDELIEKTGGFGYASFNEDILKDFVPSQFTNGIEHERKKKFIIQFLKQIRYEEMISRVQSAFENLQVLDKQTEEDEFENVLAKIVADTVLYLFHEGTIDDIELLTNWSHRTLEFVFIPESVGASRDETLMDKILKEFTAFPSYERIQELSLSSKLSKEEGLSLVIWMTLFNAYNGILCQFKSGVASYLRLSESDKILLNDEADAWFKDEQNIDTLESLKYVDAFVMENLRLCPPAPNYMGKARNDFVIETRNCKYQVREGELIASFSVLANRDPHYFQNPDQFDIHRPYQENDGELKRVVVTFGGYFWENSHTGNHKCPGQTIAVNILKLLTLHLTRCDINITSNLLYTGKHFFKRLCAVDEALNVDRFQYNKI